MMPGTAVGILNDLAPGQAAVTHGAADNETARGVDKDLAILLVEQAGGFQHGTDDRALHGFDDIGLGSGRGVLRGHDHVVDADRLAVDVFKRNLRLAVGTEEVHQTVLTDLGELLRKLVRPVDGGGHQSGSLVARKPEHHALIAGTLIFRVLTVHALRNVAGLMVDGGNNGARLPVKAHFGAVIADFLDGFADDLRQIGIALGADFTGDDGHAGRHEGFASHTGVGILFNQCIEDGIGNLVGNLIGMTFGHGLGRKEISAFFGLHGIAP